MRKGFILFLFVIVVIGNCCGCGNTVQSDSSTNLSDKKEVEGIKDKESIHEKLESDVKIEDPIDNTENNQESNLIENGVSEIHFDDQQILELFDMNKANILELYGPEYEVIQLGVEDTDEGYRYDTGLIFIFADDGSRISRIECENNVFVNGAHGGLTFNEIMKILGETTVQKYDFPPEQVSYSISYYIDSHLRCSFLSNFEDGSDSKLVIH